jgi:S-adenosylmethionine hydrolase
MNRLKNSNASYTFHGRDVYAYTGARLAAGVITFEQVGKRLSIDVIKLPYQKPVYNNGVIRGSIDILDIQYGNVWTNIGEDIFKKLQIGYGEKVKVKVLKDQAVVYTGEMIFARTFSDVPEGSPVAYMNSLLKFSLGINMGNFATKHKIESGIGWNIQLSK